MNVVSLFEWIQNEKSGSEVFIESSKKRQGDFSKKGQRVKRFECLVYSIEFWSPFRKLTFLLTAAIVSSPDGGRDSPEAGRLMIFPGSFSSSEERFLNFLNISSPEDIFLLGATLFSLFILITGVDIFRVVFFFGRGFSAPEAITDSSLEKRSCLVYETQVPYLWLKKVGNKWLKFWLKISSVRWNLKGEICWFDFFRIPISIYRFTTHVKKSHYHILHLPLIKHKVPRGT